MKKIFLIIVSLFTLTGCSVEYNLEFNNEQLKENIKIGKFNSKNINDFEYLEPQSIVDKELTSYYDFNYKNNELNLSYKYFSIDDFRKSNVIYSCFDLAGFTTDDNYYYILTSGEFKCLSYNNYTANKVTINFTTNYKVISENSDYYNKNTYTWIFDKNNKSNKTIEIKLDKNELAEIKLTTKEKILKIIEENSIFLIITIVLMLIGIIVFFINKSGKKRDEI